LKEKRFEKKEELHVICLIAGHATTDKFVFRGQVYGSGCNGNRASSFLTAFPSDSAVFLVHHPPSTKGSLLWSDRVDGNDCSGMVSVVLLLDWEWQPEHIPRVRCRRYQRRATLMHREKTRDILWHLDVAL